MFSQKRVRNFGSVLCMLAFLFIGERAMAQEDQGSPKVATGLATEATSVTDSVPDSKPLPPEKLPPASPEVTYTGELLRIDAFNSTLADILTRIATLTGADIDVPAGAKGERMVANLGPGPPRLILTSLLTDTDFDFVIISSPGDPQSILTVLLTPRGHNSGSGSRTVLAERPARNFRGMQPERMRAAENSVGSQPEEDTGNSESESASTEATPTEPAAESPAPAAATAAPENPAPIRSADASTGQAVQQSMNQQLLQLYKQRMQQTQEQRTSAHP